MPTSAKDGVTLLSELMDDAVLTSNLLDAPVRGREDINRVVRALSQLYRTEAVAYRHRGPRREYIVANVILGGGEGLEVVTVGIRDDNGWLCAMAMYHEPAKALAAQLSVALGRSAQ